MLENLPLLQEGSVVQLHPPVENRREVDSTIQLLERFGVKARCRMNTVSRRRAANPISPAILKCLSWIPEP